MPAFRDAPVPDALEGTTDQSGSVKRAHLNGKVPIFDLQTYMDDETGDSAFVVVRTVECSSASILMARASVPILWTEKVFAKSRVSKNVLQKTAKCHFQPTLEQVHSPFEGTYGKT